MCNDRHKVAHEMFEQYFTFNSNALIPIPVAAPAPANPFIQEFKTN